MARRICCGASAAGASRVAERTGASHNIIRVCSYAHGIFSSRRIERTTHRDSWRGFVRANLRPDQVAVATCRRTIKAAFEAAFLQILLLALQRGLPRVGTMSIDDAKIDTTASMIRLLGYHRAQALLATLGTDIAAQNVLFVARPIGRPSVDMGRQETSRCAPMTVPGPRLPSAA